MRTFKRTVNALLKDEDGATALEYGLIAAAIAGVIITVVYLLGNKMNNKLNNIALLLTAAIAAQGRVGLMLNVRRTDLDKILGLLPALQKPTISSLSDPDWVAVNTIIEERSVRDLIPKMKAAGGQGIVEYPLNKIVL